MFKAKEIMTEAVVSVSSDMPVYEAIRILANRNITGLPVVDSELRLVGLLSEKDVLKLLYETEDMTEQTVSDYMSRDVISYDVNDNIIDLCDCLLENPFRRVPITQNGRLAGIVSRSDLIKAILKIKHQAVAC